MAPKASLNRSAPQLEVKAVSMQKWVSKPNSETYMKPTKILIVEDDPDISFLIEHSFRKEGYLTELRHSGSRIIETIRSFEPDLLLLDLMLPGQSGYDICRIVKDSEAGRRLKVIILTSKAEEEDVLLAFDCGADDYITKPFHMQEVLARTKTVLRRQASITPKRKKDYIEQGPISIDDSRHEVRIEGNPIALTISEYRLLHLMASQPDRVFTREQLSDSISESERTQNLHGTSRNIDVHIRSLRKKLSEFSPCICTLRGVGYYFKNTSRSASSCTLIRS